MMRNSEQSSTWRPSGTQWAPTCTPSWRIKWINPAISRPSRGQSKMTRTIDLKRIQTWRTKAWLAVATVRCTLRQIRRAPWFRCVRWILWVRRRRLQVRIRQLIWKRRVRVVCKCTIASQEVVELFTLKQATQPGSIMVIILDKQISIRCATRVILRCNNPRYWQDMTRMCTRRQATWSMSQPKARCIQIQQKLAWIIHRRVRRS